MKKNKWICLWLAVAMLAPPQVSAQSLQEVKDSLTLASRDIHEKEIPIRGWLLNHTDAAAATPQTIMRKQNKIRMTGT